MLFFLIHIPFLCWLISWFLKSPWTLYRCRAWSCFAKFLKLWIAFVSPMWDVELELDLIPICWPCYVNPNFKNVSVSLRGDAVGRFVDFIKFFGRMWCCLHFVGVRGGLQLNFSEFLAVGGDLLPQRIISTILRGWWNWTWWLLSASLFLLLAALLVLNCFSGLPRLPLFFWNIFHFILLC